MAATPTPHPVTNDELIKHRLHELEELASGWRAAERRVDGLALQIAAVEKTATSIETELRALAAKTDGSLSRLHQRLDETLREQEREKGREEGRVLARSEVEAQAVEKGRQQGLGEARKTTWKVVAYTLTTTIAGSAVVVAILAIILK